MIVKWYGMPDVEGWEDSLESAQQLFPNLYNKYKEVVWRMGVNVELVRLMTQKMMTLVVLMMKVAVMTSR